MSRYKAYPAYKDSGVEWLGDIPCDWECVRLKFASELSGGKVAPSNEERYVGLENVQSNSGKFIATEEVTPQGLSNVFSSGDVLFGKLRPYLAKSWLADFSGICSSEFLVMTSRKVDSKFLHYFTLTQEFIKQVDSSTYGSKMPRASWDFIGLLNIPIPSYESEKIAAFLDHETAKIDALIEKQQRLIELLKEKRQAVISHAVTKGLNPNAPMKDSGVEWLGDIPCDWECVRLKFASELSGGKVALSNEERYVGLENVQSNSGKFIATEEVTPQGLSNVFSSGDVLFGKLRPYLAKSWLADFSGICSSEFLVMTSRKVDSKFLHYFTLTQEFIKQVDSSTYGSKMPRASWDFIGLLNIPIPSYESEKIAAFLDHETAKIDTLIEKQQRLIGLAQERRTALISAAVTGKIDLRDWQPAAAQAVVGIEC